MSLLVSGVLLGGLRGVLCGTGASGDAQAGAERVPGDDCTGRSALSGGVRRRRRRVSPAARPSGPSAAPRCAHPGDPGGLRGVCAQAGL